MTTWLFIDVPNLMFRHWHNPANGGSAELALAGFFHGLKELRARFNTDDVALAFDVGVPRRRSLRSSYKQNRAEHDKGEARAKLQSLICDLRAEHLPALGFRNVFGAEGYEADDVIASLCGAIDPKRQDSAVIVSNDRDFWQLLRDGVDIWNHKETLSASWFCGKFGIPPSDWTTVKAMAGDASDCIRGIDMVGETKAVQFLKGELPRHHLAHKNLITDNAKKVIEDNLELIELPFYGCPRFRLRPGGASEKKWKMLYERLGIGGLV